MRPLTYDIYLRARVSVCVSKGIRSDIFYGSYFVGYFMPNSPFSVFRETTHE